MPHEIFDSQAEKYDRWYDDHRATYLAELKIIRSILGGRGAGKEGSSEGGSAGPAPGATHHQAGCDLEIGAGTGRFAAPLGIRLGLDPSLPMLRMARVRGVEAIRGLAEALPFRNTSMRSILVMTSLCYFDDPEMAFGEMARVLEPGGRLIIGFLGRGGDIAEHNRETEEKGTFLAHATFYSPEEVTSLLAGAGFTGIRERMNGGTSEKGFHVMTATRPGV
jgi:SAM-dependent methyltransferase